MPWVKPDYVAPRWLSGAQIQTIFAAKVCKKPSVKYRRERWETWDDDFIDVDWAADDAYALGHSSAPASCKLALYAGIASRLAIPSQ